MKELIIKDLEAEVEGNKILKGVNLTINGGDTLALLGPNGHGKSTLLNVLMGHPHYKVTNGSITYDGKDLLAMSVDQRSKLGIFIAFQNPPEVAGVINIDFFKQAINSHREKPISLLEYYRNLSNAYKEVNLPDSMKERHLNEGFSGGEKKRNEILQMLLLKPEFCLLDEIDSGLDVDALKLVSSAIVKQKEAGASFLIISHYARLFEMVKPTRAAIMIDGRIVVDGGPELVQKVDTQGYEWIKTEYGIEIQKESDRPVILENCAVKKVI